MTLAEALAEAPVLAILRGVRPEEAVALAEALIAAGVRAIEIPLNSPEPFAGIAAIAAVAAGRAIVGAGTVLQLVDAERAVHAGARLIVAPDCRPALIARAVDLGAEPIPGFATATEAFQALDSGARWLKLFPAASYGPGHLEQLAAVLPPKARVLAVGGVGVDDIAAWRGAGAAGFGVGAALWRPGLSPGRAAANARALLARC